MRPNKCIVVNQAGKELIKESVDNQEGNNFNNARLNGLTVYVENGVKEPRCVCINETSYKRASRIAKQANETFWEFVNYEDVEGGEIDRR